MGGSDKNHFNVLLIVEGQSHKQDSVSTDHRIFEESQSRLSRIRMPAGKSCGLPPAYR